MSKIINNISVGDRIKFEKEKQSYKVVAINERYIVCVKPFNARKTYLYTIVDLKEKVRGPDNYIFSDHDYEKEPKKAIKELVSGKMEISTRRRIKLDIEKVIKKVKKK